MSYIQRTLPYFIMIISPILLAFIICIILDSKVKYEILTREIQPHGEYFITISKSNNDKVYEYHTVNVSRETFFKTKRGKISKKAYAELRGDNFDCN